METDSNDTTENNFPALILAVISIEVQILLKTFSEEKTENLQKNLSKLSSLKYLTEKFIDFQLNGNHSSYFKTEENSKIFHKRFLTIFKSIFSFFNDLKENEIENEFVKEITVLIFHWMLEETESFKSEFDKIFSKLLKVVSNDEGVVLSAFLPIASYSLLTDRKKREMIIRSNLLVKISEIYITNLSTKLTGKTKNDNKNAEIDCSLCASFLINAVLLDKQDVLCAKENNLLKNLIKTLELFSSLVLKGEDRKYETNPIRKLIFDALTFLLVVNSKLEGNLEWEEKFVFLFGRYNIEVEEENWDVILDQIQIGLNNSERLSTALFGAKWLNSFLIESNPMPKFVKKDIQFKFEELLCDICFCGPEGICFINDFFEKISVDKAKKEFPRFCSVVPEEFFDRLRGI